MKQTKIFFFCLIGFVSIFFPIKHVVAANVTTEAIPDVFYEQWDGLDPSDYRSYQESFIYVDGKVAYCIEPDGKIITEDYSSSDWGTVDLTPSQKKRIKLLAYYGYGYLDHTDYKYYLAAQDLIWKTIKTNARTTWKNQRYGFGDDISISDETKEILSLIENHEKKPSFDGNTITVGVHERKEITDTNHVLAGYQLTSPNSHVKIEKDKLILEDFPMNTTISIQLERKKIDELPTLVYTSPGSQKLAVLRLDDDTVTSTFQIEVIGGDVTVLKADNDTKENKAQGEASLQGAVYAVYDLEDHLVQSLTTDINGKGTSSSLLDYGNYYLQEQTPSKGYLLDSEKYYFEVTKENPHPVVQVYEKIIKRDVELVKYTSKEEGDRVLEENISFAIYNRHGDFITQVKTNSSGYAKVNLVYGQYKIKQVNSTVGYKKVEDFTITIDENSPSTLHYDLIDEAIRVRLKIVKIDAETSKPISFAGAVFRVKNLQTEEYLCQMVGPDKICSWETNEKGEVFYPLDLLFGEYEIEEVVAPMGYQLEKKKVQFTIDENSVIKKNEQLGEYVEILFKNEPIKGKIVVNKKGEEMARENGTFHYVEKSLKNVTFSLYASEDIVSLDGTIHYKKGDFVRRLVTNDLGQAVFEGLYLGKYLLKEIETDENYILDSTPYTIDLTLEEVSYTLSLKNNLKKGKIVFEKKDASTHQSLQGAVIEIYNEQDQLVFQKTTDSKGQIVLDNLPCGHYYLLEKEPPRGYTQNKEKLLFEITEDGQVLSLVMEDKKITSTVILYKNDSEGNPLEGVEIGLYNSGGTLLRRLITNAQGRVSVTLNYGSYYFKELKPLEGFVLSDEKIPFSVTRDGAVIKKTLENEKIKSQVILSKIDSEGNPIEGVEIDLYNEKGELLNHYVTDLEGKITLTLEYGTYYFEEVKAKEGFVLNSEKVPFAVTTNDEIIELTLENRKISSQVTLYKVDEEGNPLEGVEVGLYDEEDHFIQKYTTDKEGKIELTLEYGVYYFKELKALDGFILNEEKIFFSVLNDGEELDATLVNTKEIIVVPNTSAYQVSELEVGVILLLFVVMAFVVNEKNKK